MQGAPTILWPPTIKGVPNHRPGGWKGVASAQGGLFSLTLSLTYLSGDSIAARVIGENPIVGRAL